MENNILRIIKRSVPLIIFLVIVKANFCFGLKKGMIIPVEKLLIDALDPTYAQVKPGDTLYFTAGKRLYLNIKNLKGKSGSPIVLINSGGEVIIDTDNYYGMSIENCQFIKLTGTGFPGKFYGFTITRVLNGAGIGIGYLSSDIEVDHVSIENTLIGGLYFKTDPDCSKGTVRGAFTQYNTIIHDNYIANAGNEGMYIGSTKFSGQVVSCNGKDTLLMPSLLDGVRIYNNIIKYPGWDGIQVSSASKNCQIYNNVILYDSQLKVDTQMSGIIIGGGTKCDCYNNYIAFGNGDGIECHGLGGTRIFNNIIVEPGLTYFPNDKTKPKHGMYIADTSVQLDSTFYIMNNDIVRPKSDGIRFTSIVTKGNYIVGNVIIDPGNFNYYENGNTGFKGIDSYIMFASPPRATTVTNNYLARDANSGGFQNKNLLVPSDFYLVIGSPLIDAADYYAKTFVPFDFLYHVRPYGLKSDLGAFEYNGTTSSLPVKSYTQTNQSSLFQNPVTDLLKVSFPSLSDTNIVFQVCDFKGAILKQSRQSRFENGLSFCEINVADLSRGVYLYSVRSEKNFYSGKFIKL